MIRTQQFAIRCYPPNSHTIYLCAMAKTRYHLELAAVGE